MNQYNTKSNEKSFTIRLEPILLTLEVIKLQGYLDWSWLTFLALFLVPMAIGKLLIFYFKRKIAKLAPTALVGDTVPAPQRPKKKGKI